MKEWKILVHYNTKSIEVKTVLEYKSSQVLRIRVYGKATSLLLQNDYPSIHKAKSKRGIKWKILEGTLNAGTTENATLLMEIFRELEREIKRYYELLDKQQLGFA
jgi:hypothetical protein